MRNYWIEIYRKGRGDNGPPTCIVHVTEPPEIRKVISPTMKIIGPIEAEGEREAIAQALMGKDYEPPYE